MGADGLRERKRIAAMRRIQQVALELFDRHGYQQVPVERIAAAAEVSPSSVYRYFGTKEQLVLWDEYDPVAIRRIGEELPNQPVMAAVRQALVEMVDQVQRDDERRVRRRVHHMMTEPAITAAATVVAYEMAEMLTTTIADGLGRDRANVRIHLLAHGLTGAAIGALRYWYVTGFRMSLAELMDEVTRSLEHGFQLDS